MKLTVRSESLLERFALWFGAVPIALFETHISATLARTIMAGVELGLFECLEFTSLSAADISHRCNTEQHSTTLLLDALVGSNYLSFSNAKYKLSKKSRKWLLSSAPSSVRDKILLQAVEWRWLTHLEEFVRSGVPLDFHATMSDAERNLYHRSMRSIARIAGREVSWRTPVPRRARQMLDLGGSHGHFAASICKRHPQLNATVLDLAAAVESTAGLLAAEGLGSRVVHVVGDVTTADFGTDQYDLIFMSNLAHHLDENENHFLAIKVARALRPGGVFVVQEAVRPPNSKRGGQTATILGLYFALQSRPNVTTWTVADIRSWQTGAGLKLQKPLRLYTAPGWVQQSAIREI